MNKLRKSPISSGERLDSCANKGPIIRITEDVAPTIKTPATARGEIRKAKSGSKPDVVGNSGCTDLVNPNGNNEMQRIIANMV